MASLVIRPIPSDHDLASPVNGMVDVLVGNKGGALRLIGYDGARLNPVGGASLATGEYTAHIQSAAANGPHLAVLHSGTASGATAVPTAANSVLLVRDDYTAIGMGKQLRIYETAGTDYAQFTSADGGLAIGGSGANVGILTGLTSITGLVSLSLTTSLSVGTNPADQHQIRLPTTGKIAWRNAANTNNIDGIESNASDRILLGAISAGVILGNTTGTLGVYGATGVVKPAALTQNYATADRTLAAHTPDIENVAYVGLATALGGTPYASVVDLNALRVAYENLRTFVEDLAQFHNSHVDDHQLMGFV